jgi:hypothetical protein
MPVSDEDHPDESLTGDVRPRTDGKAPGHIDPRYLEYTWVATCIASTLGAGYAVVVGAFVSPRPVDLPEMMMVFGLALIVALPSLFVGSALIGWWITKKLVERVRTNRLLVFAMTGALLGIVADLILLVLAHLFLGLSWWDLPKGATEWLHAALVGTIPVFTLIVAGLISGLHVKMSEPAPAGSPAPPQDDD